MQYLARKIQTTKMWRFFYDTPPILSADKIQQKNLVVISLRKSADFIGQIKLIIFHWLQEIKIGSDGDLIVRDS